MAVAPDFDLSGYEKAADVDALFAAASYAYCELDSVPYSCKILTENSGEKSFSPVQGVVRELSGVTAKLTDTTTYGDYQVTVSGLSDPGVVYGVVLHTAAGRLWPAPPGKHLAQHRIGLVRRLCHHHPRMPAEL